MKDFSWFEKRELIVKDNSFRLLSNRFLDKSRKNMITLNILSEINDNPKVREILKIPNSYNADEWIVISGYYAMYSSALALLAKIGYKSKNHTATIVALEKFYLKKDLLSKEDLHLLKHASIKKEEIEELSEARKDREIAQYSITKQTTKNIAIRVKVDAKNFLDKCEEILMK